VDIHLGDGDDGAGYSFAGLPISIYGEGGSDRIAMFSTAGTLSEGGDGNDDLQGGDDVRGVLATTRSRAPGCSTAARATTSCARPTPRQPGGLPADRVTTAWNPATAIPISSSAAPAVT
jgi:hypothetical protein